MAGNQLPNVKVGRDAARDEGRDEEEETFTVTYLNHSVLAERGWGVDDEDLFEKAAEADLDGRDYGTFETGEYEYVLEAAERHGYDWPFECRAASCANCAAYIRAGNVEMDMNLYLTDEEIEEKDIRLTCVGMARSDIELIYNYRRCDYLQTVVGEREV